MQKSKKAKLLLHVPLSIASRPSLLGIHILIGALVSAASVRFFTVWVWDDVRFFSSTIYTAVYKEEQIIIAKRNTKLYVATM